MLWLCTRPLEFVELLVEEWFNQSPEATRAKGEVEKSVVAGMIASVVVEEVVKWFADVLGNESDDFVAEVVKRESLAGLIGKRESFAFSDRLRELIHPCSMG